MSNPLQQKFICSTCCVQFTTQEDRNIHFKSDYHVFNTKRRAVLLEPVSLSKYKEIISQQQATTSVVMRTYYCSLCKKRYNTEQQIKEHENTKKHKANAKKFPEKAKDCIKIEKNEDEEEEEFDLDDIPDQTLDEMIEERKQLAPKRTSKHCLFCSHESESLEANLEHMEKTHSFFIPNIELCCDIKGLLSYLHDKICIGYMCIWCSHETSPFHSYQAVRQHMIDVCHCKMMYDDKNMEEYDDFYDYSSVPEPVEIVAMDDTSMTLANGMTIGHRSMAVYYKQNIRSVESRELIIAQNKPRMPIPEANTNRYVGSKALINIPQENYIDHVKKVLRRQMTNNKTQRDQQMLYRKWTKLGVQGNKLFKPCSQTNV